jgi:hypothetical protein
LLERIREKRESGGGDDRAGKQRSLVETKGVVEERIRKQDIFPAGAVGRWGQGNRCPHNQVASNGHASGGCERFIPRVIRRLFHSQIIKHKRAQCSVPGRNAALSDMHHPTLFLRLEREGKNMILN